MSARGLSLLSACLLTLSAPAEARRRQPPPPAVEVPSESELLQTFFRLDAATIGIIDAVLFEQERNASAVQLRVERHLQSFTSAYARLGLARSGGTSSEVSTSTTERLSPWQELHIEISNRCQELRFQVDEGGVVFQESTSSFRSRSQDERRGFQAVHAVCQLLSAAAASRTSPGAALRDLDQLAVTITEEDLRAELMWKVDYVRAWILLREGGKTEAYHAFSSSVHAMEALRDQLSLETLRHGYLADRDEVYLAAMELGRQLGDPTWFELGELRRARLFVEGLRAQGSSGVDSEVISLATLQGSVLGPRELFLAYETLGERVRAVAIWSGGVAVVDVGLRRSELVGLVQSVLATSRDSREDFHTAGAHQLFSALVAPVLAETPARDGWDLVVVPSPELVGLPFELLAIESQPGPTFLAERYQLSYVVSATALSELRQRVADDRPPRLLALGDPVFDLSSSSEATRDRLLTRGFDLVSTAPVVPRLPATGDEARAAAALFEEQGGAQLLLRSEATEGALRAALAERPTHLLLATHGTLSGPVEQGGEPLLILAQPDSTGDGLLEASEVYELDLDVRVVVLSACSTGLGRIASVEGVMGFPRAFLMSGADAVVVSLWEVEDEATAELGQLFWRAVAAGRPSGQALAQARRTWLDQTRSRGSSVHPARWAALVHYGAP